VCGALCIENGDVGYNSKTDCNINNIWSSGWSSDHYSLHWRRAMDFGGHSTAFSMATVLVGSSGLLFEIIQ